MPDDELEAILHLSEVEQIHAIDAIASNIVNIDMFLSVLQSQKKHLWTIALQGIQAIGYPHNAEALPTVICFAADTNAPGWEKAVQILNETGPDVIPILVSFLLDRTQHQYWSDDIEGICASLKLLDPEYAKACGPALAYLLSREEEALNDLDKDYLLEVLEKIGLECANYVLPTLLELLVKEGGSVLGRHIRVFISSFDKYQLFAYKHILQKIDKDT